MYYDPYSPWSSCRGRRSSADVKEILLVLAYCAGFFALLIFTNLLAMAV